MLLLTAAKAKALVLVGPPCDLLDGAFNITNGEYNININRAHASPDSNGPVDLGGGGGQPSPGNSYQRCKDYIAKASIQGVVHYVSDDECGVPMLYIDNGNGLKVKYLHMDMNASNTAPDGSSVQTGDIIGTISNFGCTGGFKHIHFYMTLNGTTQLYSQWKFKPMCTPPLSGDWTLGESCNMSTNTIIPGNLTINNSASLGITSGAAVDFNFTSKHVIVQNGSKLLVTNSSKLY
jgi:hypothetical protein